MKMQWTLLLGLIFAMIIALFATLNIGKVPVNYLFGKAFWPLVLVILGSAFIGAIASACFAFVKIFIQARKIAQLEKFLNERDAIVLSKDVEIRTLREEINNSKIAVDNTSDSEKY